MLLFLHKIALSTNNQALTEDLCDYLAIILFNQKGHGFVTPNSDIFFKTFKKHGEMTLFYIKLSYI